MNFNVNRKHKNSVFSALFGTPEILRELYSAIEGIDIPADAVIGINTLSDVLYMKQINDLSFTIDDRIVVLIEHQSSISENVPLRLLMYIARLYEKIIDNKRLYQKKLEKIPTPEFIVLYNGIEPYPERKELRLSAAFKETSDIKSNKNELPLELIVHVYNINEGYNHEMQNRCKTLENYVKFTGKIKEFSQKALNKKFFIDESVTNAVRYCIEHDILKDFLKEHGAEVINMLTEEPSLEDIINVRVNETVEEYRDDIINGRYDEFMQKYEVLTKNVRKEKIREEYIIKGIKDADTAVYYQKKIIARNLFAKGSTAEFIKEITGLSLEEYCYI